MEYLWPIEAWTQALCRCPVSWLNGGASMDRTCSGVSQGCLNGLRSGDSETGSMSWALCHVPWSAGSSWTSLQSLNMVMLWSVSLVYWFITLVCVWCLVVVHLCTLFDVHFTAISRSTDRLTHTWAQTYPDIKSHLVPEARHPNCHLCRFLRCHPSRVCYFYLPRC